MDDLKLYLKISEASNIRNCLAIAKSSGYRGIITDIANPINQREFIDVAIESKQRNFTRSPLILNATEWTRETIVNIQPPNLGTLDEEIRENNKSQFKQELIFAIHLTSSCGHILINLNNNDPVALGECVKEVFAKGSRSNIEGNIIVEVPLVDRRLFQSNYTTDAGDNEDENEEDQWSIFRKFHEATDCSSKVTVALSMTNDLPDQEKIFRWLGECVSLLIIPSNCFVSNSKLYPVLPPAHKQTLALFLQITRCKIAIEPKAQFNDHLIRTYADFVNFVAKNNVNYANINRGLENELRYPLQPNYDHLDTSTYEVFEQDPAKYSLYQKAIEAAIVDKVPESEIGSKKLIVMLVGAGRGPLIRAILNAEMNTGRKIQVIVVEKNPNAIVTLSSMIDVMWKDKDIKLISNDMRTMELEEKADILVSELLGSFGDNELSPECLDGAQRHLKSDGVSIPCDSVTFIRPVMSTTLSSHTSCKTEKNVEKSLYSHFEEVNWLVYLNNVYYIDEPKELWRFNHPNKVEKINNERSKTVKFSSKVDCNLHGFAGYFTSKLYKDLEISIHPFNHTMGMASWFPMFFFTDCLSLKAGQEFEVKFERKVDIPTKIWYEWRVNDGRTFNENGIVHPLYL